MIMWAGAGYHGHRMVLKTTCRLDWGVIPWLPMASLDPPGIHQVSGLLSSPFCFLGAGSSFQGKSKEPTGKSCQMGAGNHEVLLNIRVFMSLCISVDSWNWTISHETCQVFPKSWSIWNTMKHKIFVYLRVFVSRRPLRHLLLHLLPWERLPPHPEIWAFEASDHDNLQISG